MHYQEDELREHFSKLECWDIKEAAFMLTHIEDEKERAELEELMQSAIIAGTLKPDFDDNHFKQETILAWHKPASQYDAVDTVNDSPAILPRRDLKSKSDTVKALEFYTDKFEAKHKRTPGFNELYKILLKEDLSDFGDIKIKGTYSRGRVRKRFVDMFTEAIRR